MSIKVVAFCGYFMNQELESRQEDWYSFKWVQALKDKAINGYAKVPVRGQSLRLADTNRADATKWFGYFAFDYLNAKGYVEKPVWLVPVPNKDCLLNAPVVPRTLRLAEAIRTNLNNGSVILDCLRWTVALKSAKDGGPRDPRLLYPYLALIEAKVSGIDTGRPVLLVDDVFTTSGHLQASAARLATKKLEVVMAVCGGKTVHDQTNPACYIYEESFERFKK
jgi:hypothetical protein